MRHQYGCGTPDGRDYQRDGGANEGKRFSGMCEAGSVL